MLVGSLHAMHAGCCRFVYCSGTCRAATDAEFAKAMSGIDRMTTQEGCDVTLIYHFSLVQQAHFRTEQG